MKKRIRRRLNDTEASYLGFTELKPKDKKNQNARYDVTEAQDKKLTEFRELRKSEFKVSKLTTNKNGEVISKVEKRQQKRLISVPDNHEIKRLSTNTTTGQQWIITEPKKSAEAIDEIDIESIIKKHIEPVEINVLDSFDEVDDFNVITYTDLHIGMDTDKFKKSMYPIKWDKESILESAQILIEKAIINKTSNTLIIDELGDLLDGYNGFTTRGGHSLPQNMTNEEAFDLALEFKMLLVDSLVNIYPNIQVNNICNDNHAGSFGYFVNSAFKKIVNQKYPDVLVINHTKFINHYYVGRVAFIITHGKDDSTLKFGFKPFLDSKGVEKIDQYCKHNEIYKNADLIVFKKGDSHQALFDMCTSDDFYYYNYPALSPSSQWVQNNFKKGRRGFVLEQYKGLENNIKPIFIK